MTVDIYLPVGRPDPIFVGCVRFGGRDEREHFGYGWERRSDGLLMGMHYPRTFAAPARCCASACTATVLH